MTTLVALVELCNPRSTSELGMVQVLGNASTGFMPTPDCRAIVLAAAGQGLRCRRQLVMAATPTTRWVACRSRAR